MTGSTEARPSAAPVRHAADDVSVVTRRRIRPVLLWSGIGAICVVFAAYVYLSWILSGNASSVGTGSDSVPTRAAFGAWAFQIATVILALSAVIFVIRKSLIERKLCAEAMVVVGSMIAWWHDPLINWLQPVVFYNATLVNFGAWTENIPGWISPNGRFLAEPVLMIGLAYIWMPLYLGLLGRWAMSRARAARPGLGALGIFAAGWVAVFAVEFSCEVLAVHTGLVGYPAGIPNLTLWSGSTHQVPIYGPLIWSTVLTSSAALLFFRDVHGLTVVERGIDRVRWAGKRTRTVLSVLAITGFIHVVAIVGYDVPMNLAGLYAGPTQTYPTYLRTELCGPGTPVGCPDGTAFRGQ